MLIVEKPLVSVIMNGLNAAAYARAAIDSVLAQTYSNWEIVFWDNRSSDNTAAIVRGYTDPRIRYFLAPEFTPLGAARNQAIQQAGGDFIAFHGKGNPAIEAARGYRVEFVPFRGANAGPSEGFANGFAQGNANAGKYRPGGLAVGPDGSLYIADSQAGRIWRVVYKGE